MNPSFDTGFTDLQKRFGFDSYHPRYNLGVAASWNRILLQAISRGHEFCYIGSNDTFLGPGMLKAFSEFDRRPEEGFWGLHHFNFFCIRLSILEKVGIFDENYYPGYWEDDDFRYRCCLAGIRQVYFLDPAQLIDRRFPPLNVFHAGSQTCASDSDYPNQASLNDTQSHGFLYYVKKWGGSRHNNAGPERFRTPFNLPDKPLSWWPDPGREQQQRDWDNVKRARNQK